MSSSIASALASWTSTCTYASHDVKYTYTPNNAHSTGHTSQQHITIQFASTCCCSRKVQQRVVCRKEVQQHFGLAVGDPSRQPGVKLGNVSLQRNATQPPVQAEVEVPHGGGHVAQDDPQRDRDPGCVWVNPVVVTFWQQVDEVVPHGKACQGHCTEARLVSCW